MNSQLSPQEAASELLRRRKARSSLIGFANSIDIPGKPVSDNEDEWLFQPVETTVAAHHRLMMEALQEVIETQYGRLMLLLPPGSAKSTYASRVLPAYYLGTGKDRRCILASYGSDLAKKHGRAARAIVRTTAFTGIFGCTISNETSAADEWALTNGSEFMAGGILSGITGNRAGLLIIDDPVKGRDEAESETIRSKTISAYQDDLLTRLLPGASVVLIQTRWHQDDLAGSILPLGYNGESGMIECRDGQTWNVLCLQAKCERDDDPLGRKIGEYLWPEWFDRQHWEQFERNPRTWSSLYQQRPAPEEGTFFKREWFNWYDERPKNLRFYAASDYAVSDGEGDYTVHLIAGMDKEQNIYLVDMWRGQEASMAWINAFCGMVRQWRPLKWAEEQGQIIKSLGPYIDRSMREQGAWVMREQFTSTTDKVTRARSIQGYAEMGRIYLPYDAPWVDAFMAELLTFPVGRNDDQVDAFSLLGRLLDTMIGAHVPEQKVSNPSGYRSKRMNGGGESWRI